MYTNYVSTRRAVWLCVISSIDLLGWFFHEMSDIIELQDMKTLHNVRKLIFHRGKQSYSCVALFSELRSKPVNLIS